MRAEKRAVRIKAEQGEHTVHLNLWGRRALAAACVWPFQSAS